MKRSKTGLESQNPRGLSILSNNGSCPI
jgi:hypothetical protein